MFKISSFEKKGIALTIVVGTILVVVILANMALNLILSHFTLTTHQINRIRAMYAARAAISLAMERLRLGNYSNFSLCASGCTVNDSDIPYRVNVTIGSVIGSGPFSGTRQINAVVNYTQ